MMEEVPINIHRIYELCTPGSKDFINMVKKYCSFEISDIEIFKLSSKLYSGEAFLYHLENSEWWKDSYKE